MARRRHFRNSAPLRRRKRATARAAAAPASETPPFLRQSRDVLQPVVVRSRRLKDDAVRSAGARPEVALQIEAEPGEEYLLVVKHPSGALSFHRGIEVPPSPRRGGRGKKAVRKGKAKSVIEFRAPIAASAHPDVRRGVFGDFLQGIVDAIIVQVGEVIAETAVDLAEAAIWRLLGREQGLYRITSAGTTRRAARACGSPDGHQWSRPAFPPWHILHDPFGVRRPCQFGTLPEPPKSLRRRHLRLRSLHRQRLARGRMRTSSSQCCRSGAL